MDYRREVEKAYASGDVASVPGGMFHCSYVEAYVDSLDIQGVERTISCPRHIAQARGVDVGTVISWVKVGNEFINGPFRVETFEPNGRYVVTLRLRKGNG